MQIESKIFINESNLKKNTVPPEKKNVHVTGLIATYIHAGIIKNF